MVNIDQIRELRRASGLTQVELAHLSQVSLPFIQKIEAGGANPSIQTLEAIYAVFGIEISTRMAEPDWSLFETCGAPLSVPGKSSNLKPNVALLSEGVRKVGLFFSRCESEARAKYTRELEALQALLIAIRDYYPSVFHKYFASSSFVDTLPTKLNGRLIKLRRIALSKIADYL